jgi:molybdate transport system permease protein
MDLQAFALSLKLAAVTTAILMVIAIPLGYWLAFGRSRARPIVQAVVTLPLVLPPTVLGFYLLVLLGARTSTGRALAALFGHPLAFSFTGLTIGSIVYSLPFAVQPVVTGFAGIDDAIRESASLLCPSRAKVAAKIFLPLIRPALWTAVVLAFAHTMGEFGVVLMIGGGIPGVTKTLSIAIYDQVQNFDYTKANYSALGLLVFSLAALLVVHWTRRPSVSRGLPGD